MLTIDKLNAYGAKVDEGLGRCLNNEAMYFRLIAMAAENAAFGRLEESLKAGDLDGAFSAAHNLKGALGNLALEPIYRPAAELTELLRDKTPGDYEALMEKIRQGREALRALIRD